MGWKDHLKWGSIITAILLLILLYAEFFYRSTLFDIESLLDNSRFMVFGYFALPNIVIAIIGGLYGSIFPDIDIGTSKAYAITYSILILIAFYYAYTGFLLGLCIGLAIMLFIIWIKHRGVMHSPITAIVLGVLTFIFFESMIIALFFFIGFMVHLACDRDMGDE